MLKHAPSKAFILRTLYNTDWTSRAFRIETYPRQGRERAFCLAAILGAGCHGTPNTSGYGIAWISLTDEPGDYAAYVITIDSITLERNDGVVVTAVATPEVVDFTQVHNIAELWSSGAIPTGTYVSATITLDYTNAFIAVVKNGESVEATSSTTRRDTTSDDLCGDGELRPAERAEHHADLRLDERHVALHRLRSRGFGRGGSVADGSDGVRASVLTDRSSARHTRLIRVRGPLANSSTDVSTYTVYIRPFYDEANNLGQVTLFSQPSTVYTLNGHAYLGSAGLAALSVLSAGSTMTAGFTTFQPDYNPLNGAYAGRFNLQYVVAGSTLEDNYTEGISGDVIARKGDMLTLRGSTLFLNTADTFSYERGRHRGLLGPDTIVTADDNALLDQSDPELDRRRRSHHRPRNHQYRLLRRHVILDSTGTTSTNTGSVRLQASEVFGTLESSASGSLVMDVSTINLWPVPCL